jgi:salicylate hydroxylase
VLTIQNWDERADELKLQENTLAVHRADAHDILRQTALAFPNVDLSLRSPVASVDPEQGTVTLESGESHHADVVIGSDGIHSKTVHAIDDSLIVEKTSRNAYRFMVPTEKAMADQDTKAFLESYDWTDILAIFFDKTGTRNTVMYPCRGGSLINVATFTEAGDDKEELGDAWNNPASVEDLVKVMDGFPEGLVSLAKLGEDIKHWASGSRDCPKSFVKHKLALIGDAAHPMPPTWTAGAGTGIEDGAALGVLLDKGTTPDQVEKRLELYNKARYERGVTIKYASENVGEEQVKRSKGKLEELCPGASIPEDMAKYLWTEDVIARCQSLLQVAFV